MKRLVVGFVWLGIFTLLLVALDQVLLRYRGFEQPFLRDVQEFHADFRRRLFGLPQIQIPQSKPARAPEPEAVAPADTSADAVVEREITRVTQQAVPGPQDEAEDGSLRYIYLDAEQNIQFAEHYEDIPPRFRDAVQVVGE
ncbi:MAG: hypothetical protein ABR516_03085 [Desulfuromonadaceae bacterium]|nr:hypothetical protein [Geobacteraceae bacterium]